MKKYCFKNHCGFSIIDGRLWTYYKGETINDKWVYILLMNQRMQFMPFGKCFYISANCGYLCYLSFGLRGEAVLGPLPLPGAGPSLNPQHSWHREASCRESLATALRSGVSNAPPLQWDPTLTASFLSFQLCWCLKVHAKTSMRTQTRKKFFLSTSCPSSMGKFCISVIYIYYLGGLLPVELGFPSKESPP